MPEPGGSGRTLRSRRRVEDDQDDGPGENFIFDNVSQSGDEDDTQPITRARHTPATSTPVAQVINDVTLAPVQVPSTADVQFFFNKESADKVFCKECKYVDDLIHSFLLFFKLIYKLQEGTRH